MYMIDRGELLMQMMHKFHYELPDGCNNPLYGDVIKVIEDAPTIEAEPVRHGQWVIEMDDMGWLKHTCPNCGYVKRTDIHVSLGWNFCPNCGDRMDGDANDEG